VPELAGMTVEEILQHGRLRARERAIAEENEVASDNAEDFKQGAKIAKAAVSLGECVGTLLKIPLC